MNDVTARDRVEAQTRIRLALLRNGYVPLANRDKMCVLTGWPGLKVDKAMIVGWADQLRYVATGIRVDGPLVVLDFDIDSTSMLDAIWAGLDPRLRRILDAAPMRFGGGDKFALFLRMKAGEARFGRMVSQGYAPPGSEIVMRVEAFDSGAARQFGVYGARSHGQDGAVETEYTWADNWGLADVPLGLLPEITVADVKAVCDAASTAMREAGWGYEVRTHEGVVDDRPVHDIALDAEFVTRDHGVLDLAGLEALCEALPHEGVRLSASWLEGPSAVNAGRCIARLNAADGRLQIWESASCRLHRLEGTDVGSKVAELGRKLSSLLPVAQPVEGDSVAPGGLSRLDALLASVAPEKRLFAASEVSAGGGSPDEDDVSDFRERLLSDLRARYAYWSDGRGFVVDVQRGPEAAMALSSYRAKLAPFAWMQKTKRGEVEVNPADVWLKDAARMDVDGYRFMPWSRDRLVEDKGQVYVNIWERPAHWEGAAADESDDDSTALAAFRMFLGHLIPDDRERDWFVNWLACKVQRPWVPNCGVIMVAERQGTGRGTLFDVLRAVFGSRHVRSVGAAQLLGNGSQAQYTDWLADSLLVTCDEVLAGDDAAGNMTWKRREAYERLKGLVDPRARDVMVVRKGLPNYQGETYASFLLATNNVNALPLSPDDRRIAVVTNTAQKLVQNADVLYALEPWRTDVGFGEALGGAIYRWLSNYAVDTTAAREAPMWMVGRARMLAANEGDLESVLDSVLREIPGDYILNNHLRDRLRNALAAGGLEDEIKHWWTRASDMLGRVNMFGWRRRDGRCRYQPGLFGNSVAVVFYRDEPGVAEAWEAANLEERAALWKPASDLNQKASRLAERLAERGLTVKDGGRAS